MALATDSSPVPLDLVRAFKDAGIAHGVDINISGTPEDPLFQANQVGALLGITNIRKTVHDFDEYEVVKGVTTGYTLGGPQTAAFLTELGLYRLLGMSRKPIARPFQKWVAQVIKEIRLKGMYDMQLKLAQRAAALALKDAEATEAKSALLERTTVASELRDRLELVETERDHLVGKFRKKQFQLGDTVYIRQNISIPAQRRPCRVGGTGNLRSRDTSYKCHDPRSRFTHTRKCHNWKVLEKAVHVMLRAYRTPDSDEVFDLPYDVVHEAIDSLQLLIDNCGPHVKRICEVGLYKRIAQIVHEINQGDEPVSQPDEADELVVDPLTFVPDAAGEAADVPAAARDVRETASEASYAEDAEGAEGAEVAGPGPGPVADVADAVGIVAPSAPAPNRLDFDAFLAACFETSDPLATVVRTDAHACFRLWSRDTDNDTRMAAIDFLEKRFANVMLYDLETKAEKQAFKGLSLRPTVDPPLPPNPTEADLFVHERCARGVAARVSTFDLQKAFVAWKAARLGAASYKLTAADKRALNVRMSKEFLSSVVYTHERTRIGFYGAALKDHPSSDTGRRIKMGNRKHVNEIESSSGKVLRSFESLTHASHVLGMHISCLSLRITRAMNRNDRVYRFAT